MKVKTKRTIKTLPDDWSCPNCGSSSHTVLGDLPTTIFAGDFLGKPYTSVIRVRVQCQGCEQISIKVDRNFDKKLWGSNEG